MQVALFRCRSCSLMQVSSSLCQDILFDTVVVHGCDVELQVRLDNQVNREIAETLRATSRTDLVN